MLCYKCGYHLEETAKMCENCGSDVKGKTKAKKQEVDPFTALKMRQETIQVVSPAIFEREQLINNRYKIVRPIETDPIGITYQAFDVAQKNNINLKTVYPHLLNDNRSVNQFFTVIDKLKVISHENIARIFDAGKVNEYFFYTFQYAEGLPLWKILDMKRREKQNFSLQELDPIVNQVANGLDSIYEHHISHGLLTPKNIIVLPDIIKVTNFGILEAFPLESLIPSYESEGKEYYYLSPDVRSEKAASEQDDLFSLTVVLAQMLTGLVSGFDTQDIGKTLTKSGIPEPLAQFLSRVIDRDYKSFQNIDKYYQEFKGILKPIIFGEDNEEVKKRNSVPADTQPEFRPGPIEVKSTIQEDPEDKDPTVDGVPVLFSDDEEHQVYTEIGDGDIVLLEDDAFPEDAPLSDITVNNQKPLTEVPEQKKATLNSKDLFSADIMREETSDVADPFESSVRTSQHAEKVPKNRTSAPVRGQEVDIEAVFTEPTLVTSAGVTAVTVDQPAMQRQYQPSFESFWSRVGPWLFLFGAFFALVGVIVFLWFDSQKQKMAVLEQNQIVQQNHNEPQHKNETNRKSEKEETKTVRQSEQRVIEKNEERDVSEPKKKTVEKKSKLESFNIDTSDADLELDVNIPHPPSKKTVASSEPSKENIETAKESMKEELAMSEIKEDESSDESLVTESPAPTPEPVKKEPSCPKSMVMIASGSFSLGSSPNDPMRNFGDKNLKQISSNSYCIDYYEYPNGLGLKPVANITYSQAEQLCQQKGKRLCTEEEWEYACKGKGNKRFPYGDIFDATACNSQDELGESTDIKTSGSFRKCRSGFGVYDLSGNIAEWTSSSWSGGDGVTLKGGSFQQPDYGVRCASRENMAKGEARPNLGFRCCADPQE